jgi:hypothetical protein
LWRRRRNDAEPSEKFILRQVPFMCEENDVAEDVVGQIYDPDKNQLPYGGAVDMNGRIVWAVTKEEAEATRERIRKAFGKK